MLNMKVNKQKIITWIGLLLVCIGAFGIVATLFGGNNTTEEKSNKLHYLCIGVDKYEIMGEREPVYNSIGQGDGIFLITLDEDNGLVDIVAVPRDTMVTIQKYYSNMEYIGEEKAQICLQYAYADGKERSCELMVDRVEELFDGIEIDGYVAINMASVMEINDAIGGVTVEVHNEDTAQKMEVEVGSSVHLTRENIHLYLQSRDKSEAKSAYGRMDRLKDYVKAFLPKAIQTVKENPAFIVEIINLLGKNMVMDLEVADLKEITSIISGLSEEKITYQTLEGKVVVGSDGLEEFYPNQFKLKKIMKDMK